MSSFCWTVDACRLTIDCTVRADSRVEIRRTAAEIDAKHVGLGLPSTSNIFDENDRSMSIAVSDQVGDKISLENLVFKSFFGQKTVKNGVAI